MKNVLKGNNRFVAIFVAVIVLAITVSVAIINTTKAFSNDSNSYAEHVPGEVIAWLATDSYTSPAQANDLQNSDNANLRAQANSKINEFLTKYDCTTLACYAGDDETYRAASNDTSYITVKNPLLNAETNSLNTNPKIPVQERVVSVKFNESQNSMSNIIAELEKNPLVKFSEPNYIGQLDSVGDLTQFQYAYDSESGTAPHNNVGMNVEGWNAKDNIPESDKVVAAVIDTGVDTTHPDIPLAGREGGYDLTQIAPGGEFGYNATADLESEEAKNPKDIVGHGTHVSGSIAAKWDKDSTTDNKGVSGGASKCYILPVRLANSATHTSVSAYAKATSYLIAAKQSPQKVNIKSANNSWSISAPSKTVNENVTKSGLAGIISLFSSGNDSKNIDNAGSSTSTLANNPYAIKVDSTNEQGYKSNFSNYGVRTTDVCAPGTNILSSVPTYDIENSNGEKQNLKTSDTRVLTQNTDYTMIDDFEGNLAMRYLNPSTAENLSVAGSSDDPRGYNSPHAIYSPVSCNASFLVTGNLQQYKRSGTVNNMTFLFNTDTGKKENDNGVAVSVFDLRNGQKMITGCQASTASTGYMPVSFPVDLISNLDNAVILIQLVYYDEEKQIKPADAYLDNVAMAYVEMPYAYRFGTSMSTPACTGMAAIVANTFKNDPIEKNVARIKGGTNKKEWLSDVCYTGGIVDLERACSAETGLDPVLLNARMSTSSNGSPIVELTGYFLGDQNSTVTINGQTATNVAYAQKEGVDVLTCTFANPITGEAKITVTKQNGNTLTRYFDFGDSSNLLETLPQPPKNDSRFDDYYSACDTELLSTSNNYILINAIAQFGDRHSFKYDINKKEWSPSDIKTKIQEKIGNDHVTGFLNSKDNTLYYAVLKDAVVTGLLRYDAESEEVIDYETFSDSGIKNPAWLIIEDNEVYLGDLTKNGYDAYSYNYNDKKLTLVTSGLQCGLMPKVFKQSDGHYIFIDNGLKEKNSSTDIIADLYNVTLDENGFSSQKSDIQAYPEQAKAYKQDTNIGYAYWNGQIITFGPAEFAGNSNNQNAETYGYVTADSFSIDANTGASTALPKVMQNYKVAKLSTRACNNIIYTSFIDKAGTLQVAKRVLDVPPSPKPPTPDPPTPDPGNETVEPAKLSAAATGDANWGLLTLAIFAGLIASCSIAYSFRATKQSKL